MNDIITQKPIILCDVDGVLNPAPFDSDFSKDWKFEPTFRSSLESGGWPLNLSKEMGQALLDLNCEIRWLTTWIRDADFANKDIGPALGWEKQSLCIIERHFTDPWWKPRAVGKLLQDPGPKVIWIDDEADRFINLFEKEVDPHHRLLVINPVACVGITRADIDTIKKFISEELC